MAKRDGSEAWHEFQAAFVRKLEIAEEQGEKILFPPRKSSHDFDQQDAGVFNLTEMVETGAALPIPMPPTAKNKKSESLRAAKLVQKLLDRREKIETSNEIAVRVETKLEELRADPAKKSQHMQRVREAIILRNSGSNFAETQARHIENLKKFSFKDRKRLLTAKRERAEQHARETLERARKQQELVRQTKLEDQYRRHHRNEIAEHQNMVKKWIVGCTAYRITTTLMKQVREEKLRRLEQQDNATVASLISSASGDPEKMQKIKHAIWTIMKFFLRYKMVMRERKKKYAADLIVEFARDCEQMSSFKVVVRRFLRAVRSFQRYCRSFLACSEARKILLRKIWENLEEDIAMDRQERIIKEAMADDPNGAEEYFRDQIMAKKPERNTAGVTIEQEKEMTALDKVIADGGKAKHSFRERARMTDMSQKLLTVANLKVQTEHREQIIPEILLSLRQKFKALCPHKGAVISNRPRKEALNERNVKEILEGNFPVEYFLCGDDDGTIDKVLGMKKKDNLIYKMPPAEDRFKIFSFLWRIEMLQYIQSAQRLQGTPESLMTDPELIPPHTRKVSNLGHKSKMNLTLGDRVFLNPVVIGMRVTLPSVIVEENGPKKKKKKKKKLKMTEETASKIQSRLRAAMIGVEPQVFFDRHDRDHTGHFDNEEFRILMRTGLKITKEQCSDEDVGALLGALDDDDSGYISITELVAFMRKGMDALTRRDDEAHEPDLATEALNDSR